MLAMKVLSSDTYYNATPDFAKKHKEKTLQSSKGCNACFYNIQLCSDSLFVLMFDFRNLFRRSGHNP